MLLKTLPGSFSVGPQCRDRWRWTLPTFEVDWTKTGSSSCRRPENFCHLLGKLKNTNLVKFGLCWSGNYIWNRGFDYNWPFNQLQEIFFRGPFLHLYIHYSTSLSFRGKATHLLKRTLMLSQLFFDNFKSFQVEFCHGVHN